MTKSIFAGTRWFVLDSREWQSWVWCCKLCPRCKAV